MGCDVYETQFMTASVSLQAVSLQAVSLQAVSLQVSPPSQPSQPSPPSLCLSLSSSYPPGCV